MRDVIVEARAALITAAAYMQYELNELPAHHPTLPSAIGKVAEAINACDRALADAPTEG